MNTKHLFTGFAVVLLAYSAWRSFDYLTIGLKGVDPTIATVVSLVFLFASEIGLLLWLHAGVPHSTTDAQETIAKGMIGVDFVGSLALGVADLLLRNTVYIVDFHWLDPILLVAPALLVAANVGAVVLFHLSDAEEQLRRAERQLDYEESQLEIEARLSAIKELRSSRREIGSKLAPSIYAHVRDRVTGRTVKRFEHAASEAKPKASTDPAQSAAAPVEPGANGRNSERVYPAESENFLAQQPQDGPK